MGRPNVQELLKQLSRFPGLALEEGVDHEEDVDLPGRGHDLGDIGLLDAATPGIGDELLHLAGQGPQVVARDTGQEPGRLG